MAAERMITRELTAITSSGKVNNGILNPNDLEENERILLEKYLDYKVSRNCHWAMIVWHPERDVHLLPTFIANMARNLSLAFP